MIIKNRWWQIRWQWVRKGQGYYDRNGRKRRALSSGFRQTFYFRELL